MRVESISSRPVQRLLMQPAKLPSLHRTRRGATRSAMTDAPNQTGFLVAELYRFARLDDLPALKAELAAFCCSRGIQGTLLLAHEGVNGTVAGGDAAIGELIARLGAIDGIAGIDVKYSRSETMPFHRMKVRLKREIVTMGRPDVDPSRDAGVHVEPAAWNALISDPDTVVVDVRNDYEVAVGTFAGAVDPGTASFTEFPAWLEARRGELAGRKVAMFCTGGIRCEKATAYAASLGIANVFHLRGGILRYLEDVPASESLWRGECFVFDERVAVTHGLERGETRLCRACRRPLTSADMNSPHYREGVSCAHCHAVRSDEDRERYAERHRQVELAAARGRRHIGS
jgi:UPF0176 protein